METITRPANYYDRVDRSSNVYNPNAVNVLYLAEELQAVDYSQEVFGNRENYLLWLQAQAEQNIMELIRRLSQLNEQAGRADSTISGYLLAGAGVLVQFGVPVVAGAIVASAGALISFVERKQRNNELANIKIQAEQIIKELNAQKSIYDRATSDLKSIRNERILIGLFIAFLLYLFTRKRS